MGASNPPASRTIYADQVRAGRAARIVQQPSEKQDYAVNFTKLLPIGFTSFSIASVTYGVGVAAFTPVADNAGIVYVFVDTFSVVSGTDGVITVVVTYTEPGGNILREECEFTIACRDQH
jgi:hypothetical protein